METDRICSNWSSEAIVRAGSAVLFVRNTCIFRSWHPCGGGGISPGCIGPVEGHPLVADDILVPIRRHRSDTTGVHPALGPGRIERAFPVDVVQPLEIQVATVHHIGCTSPNGNQIQSPDIVHLSVADVDEGRDRTPEIQQRVDLYGALGCPKRGPIEQPEAQVDGRGIEHVDGAVETEPEILAAVELVCSPNEGLYDFDPDAPIAVLVGIG